MFGVTFMCLLMAACGGSGSGSTSSPVTPVPAATPTFSLAAGTYTSVQTVTLADATPSATLYYTTDGSTPTTASTPYTAAITVSSTETIKAIATATGSTASNVASAAYTITLPTASPTFSLAAGTYTSTQTVAISDATPGAIIYYTTDGSIPTATSAVYTAPLAVATTETIKAIANATGSTTSNIASATYTITLPAATPTFSLAAGAYTSVQTVSLADATSGATIYYTTDGSTPTTASTSYTSAIPVSMTETIKAIANATGSTISNIASATYTITLPPTILTVRSGSGQSVQVDGGFASPLQVQALDARGNPTTGIAVTFSAPSTGPGVSFSSPSCTTDSNGLCSVTARANAAIGTYTVTASTPTLNAAFTLTNTGLHSFIVTVSTDTTTGTATNCLDQAVSSGSANSTCSLRDALAAAALAATPTQSASITFAQTAPATITLANGTLNLPAFTTVQGATSGAGAGLTNLITLDGNNITTIFTEAAGVSQAAINNMIITHGYASQTGAGIFMKGSLAVNNSTFVANQSAISGGAVANSGGILVVFGSTFVNNIAQSGYGGALDNYTVGTMDVSNSTFSGNKATYGGAIYNSGAGTGSTATIIASTVSGNTGSTGGGIYNLGAMTISSSIVNGNTPVDCGGIYCNPLWVYVVFASATPTVVDSTNITIAFSDSLGNTFSQTVGTGPYSSPASVASTFGPYFYENFSGLDTTFITGQSFGNLLVIAPQNGATLSPLSITNPGSSFTVTQVSHPLLLSVNQNVSGATTSQIDLSPLGDNGGPTQTMVPLSGSNALCVISPSTATGTDQRGQPRTATVGATSCQDAGAVQTSN